MSQETQDSQSLLTHQRCMERGRERKGKLSSHESPENKNRQECTIQGTRCGKKTQKLSQELIAAEEQCQPMPWENPRASSFPVSQILALSLNSTKRSVQPTILVTSGFRTGPVLLVQPQRKAPNKDCPPGVTQYLKVTRNDKGYQVTSYQLESLQTHLAPGSRVNRQSKGCCENSARKHLRCRSPKQEQVSGEEQESLSLLYQQQQNFT